MSMGVVDDVAALVSDLGISEVVHFTRNSGMLGIASHGAVLAREHLPKAKHLRYVYEPNAKVRKDIGQLDYVNLSIDRINASFFVVSANKWYAGREGLYWCVLAFSPDILAHQGVLFATTNNMYTGVLRGEGLEGLRALYATRVVQWENMVIRRPAGFALSWPTCRQAEVLYQNQVPIEYLRTVYVRAGEHADEVQGWLKTFRRKGVAVKVDPDKFQ